MRKRRRLFLQLAAAVAVLSTVPQLAAAQGSYPTRPVRFIVGQAAGSSSDITARLIAQWLSERLGQQFVVEARPGAGGNIATEAVVRSPPDGYTLLLVNAQNTINAALYDQLNFDFLRDIVPVAWVDRVAMVMEVTPTFPAKTVPEFIAYAKANPGKINMASAGIGGPQHVAGELFKFMAGVDMIHVPYRGTTPAVTDLLGGQVQVMFDVTPTALPQIAAGKLRALAVTTAERLAALPDLPTIGKFLKGYEASAWIGVGAPKGTPANVIATLNREINAAIVDPTIKRRLDEIGALVAPPSSPAEFASFIADDAAKWAKVIKSAGIKPQ
jgi:tripartite-type tricarboxylate transporter receptor subunit TctC